MCEFTIPGKPSGAGTHSRRGELACAECRAAESEYRRRIYRPAQHRRQTIWKHYRLRQQDYDAILAQQNGSCAICHRELKQRAATHIDHDHRCDHPDKGKFSCAECVRGILCARCNWSLHILDNPELLASAIRYLGREDVAAILRESRLF